MTARIPLSVPLVGALEKQHVLEALDSGWIAPAGPQLDRFEAEVATRTGRRRAVGVSSGTAALHLALLVVGVRPGDLVLCPTLSFVASANAVVHSGAVPMFVDCDGSGAMEPVLVEKALEEADRLGRRVGAVLAVDVYGSVADHVRLEEIARHRSIPLVVDAAESLGSVRDGRPAGSAGTVAAVSFNGNKIVTASSGGAVLTDDDTLADAARHLATQAREPLPYYEHRAIGFNYRLSNILAAVGLAQMEQLDTFIAARRAHRSAYGEMCAQVEGLSLLGGEDSGSNCWLTTILLDPELIDVAPTTLSERLAREGIESRPVFAPLHLQPVYADTDVYPRRVDGTAERLYRTGLSLPSSPASSAADIGEVCERILAVARARPAHEA